MTTEHTNEENEIRPIDELLRIEAQSGYSLMSDAEIATLISYKENVAADRAVIAANDEKVEAFRNEIKEMHRKQLDIASDDLDLTIEKMRLKNAERKANNG